MKFRGVEVGFGVFFGVVGLIRHRLRDGSMIKQVLRTNPVLARQLFVIHCLEIRIVSVGYIGTLYLEKQFALLDVVVKPHFNADHAAIGKGDHRHLARDVGKDRACGAQFGGDLHFADRCQGELGQVVLVDGDQVHVGHFDHLGGWRRAVA